jgi:hypothetical protein
LFVIQFGQFLVEFVRSPVRTVRRLLANRPDDLSGWFKQQVFRVLAFLRQLPRAVWRVIQTGFSSQQSGQATDTTSNVGGVTSTDRPQTVRQVWVAFIRIVFRRVNPTDTPEELADAAVERGFPEQPVRKLTRAFQDAMYNPGEDPDAGDDTTAALREIEARVESKSGETSGEAREETDDR